MKKFKEVLSDVKNKKSVAAEIIRITKILKENGVDLRKIQITKTVNGKATFILLREIKQEGIDIGKIIEENGLDGEFKYGTKVHSLRLAYKGKGSCAITKKEKREAEELGLLKKESVIDKTLKVAKILKENGVDLRKIQITKNVNGKVTFTLLREIEQEGIDIEKIIEENGLDGEFKYGQRVKILRLAYKGKGSSTLTEKEKREAEELGLLQKVRGQLKKINKKNEIIRIAKILKENGVDLRNIQLSKNVNGKKRYILLKEIQQEKIDIKKILEENELDGEFKYGKKVYGLRLAYKGFANYVMTEEEKREVEELGLLPRKESAVAETIRIAKILKENGVDLRKIQLRKYANGKTTEILLREIKQEGIDIEKIIEENGLDGEFKYGQRVRSLIQAYRGKGSSVITEKEKCEAEELGLVELEEKESAVAETIRIARILKENGVDLRKIQLNKYINRKQNYILLKEIKQEGIDIEKIIKENNLDKEFKYGQRVRDLRESCKETRSSAITEEEKREAEELGLLEEKESAVAETIRIAKILKENGVDLGSIQLSKKVNDRNVNILLREIKQEGIDIEKIIEENGLDGEFKYGQRVKILRQAYKGKGGYKITEDEKRQAEELGLLTMLSSKEVKKQEALDKNKEVKLLLEEYEQELEKKERNRRKE